MPLRRNIVTARACDADTEAVIKDWLRFSGHRSGGRRHREGIMSQETEVDAILASH